MGKIICINGDSYAQESYLEPQHRWSNIIGATHNLALGGGSNDRTFYTTIEYLNQNNPDILIIGWTETSRAMLSNLNGSRMIVTLYRAFAETTGNDYPEFIKFYYGSCFNEFVNFKNTLEYMVHLQEYCKIKNIKLFYYRSLLCDINEKILIDIASKAYMSSSDKNVKLQGIKHNLSILKTLINKLDKGIWIKEFWYSMPEHCKDFPKKDKYGHPNEDGSAHWAELIKKYL